jgi:uncharacterized protein
VRVAILSDTHFPGRGTTLPAACLDVIAGADLVIHAGDLADMPTLALLRALGPPLVAVHGNADDDAVRRALPASASVDLPELPLIVVHNGGPEDGRLERMRRKFPDAAGVIFGHSHIPLHQVAPDGFFILNPGSATDRRKQPRHSMVELVVGDGGTPQVTFHAVDEPVGFLPDELIRR